jgi:hypothetical protein
MANHVGNSIEFRQAGNLLLVIQCDDEIRTQAFIPLFAFA